MAHHEPFKALGPIDWTTVSAHEDAGSLPSTLAATLADAQTIVDSIPGPVTTAGSNNPTGRPRAATDSAALGPAPTGGAAAAALRPDWKEVKLGGGPRDNPHAVSVYRLAARDGRGTWFARRSLHRGFGFARWRAGLQAEFDETMKRANPGEPGTGNIRGIGAEKRVEARDLGDDGLLRVYQLSARFPGPTTPRDFITLLLTAESLKDGGDSKSRRRPRQFTAVSKPCTHPDCPQRQGFIRGQYESVEIIREVPVDRPLRRVRSSIDVSRDPFSGASRESSGNLLGKQAIVRSARQTASDTDQSGDQTKTVSFAENPARQSKSEAGSDDEDEVEMAIEWLMVTRSDPGGSVPRFLVEKGTPPGIVTDAGRLIDWLSKEHTESTHNEIPEGPEEGQDQGPLLPTSSRETALADTRQISAASEEDNTPPSSFYGMITSAIGAAGSVAVSKLLNQSSSTQTLDQDDEEDSGEEEDDDDVSSSASFASAEEGELAPAVDIASSSLSTKSAVSGDSHNPAASAARHEKALRKLEDRRRAAEEKTARAQERAIARRREDEERDAQAVARLREKHEKELAKQETKFRREREKLEERRRAEEKKAEDRRRKAAEKEERADLQMALEKARAEKDVALKQIEILKEQVGALQAQNTRLVREAGEDRGHG